MPSFDWPPPWGRTTMQPLNTVVPACDYRIGKRTVRVLDWRTDIRGIHDDYTVIEMTPSGYWNERVAADCDTLLDVYAVLCELEKTHEVHDAG